MTEREGLLADLREAREAGCNGADCNGADCNGADCNGADCNGADCNGAECNSAVHGETQSTTITQ